MPSDTLTLLLDAVRSHAWLAVVGYGITIVVAIARKLGPELWRKLPRRLQWLPAVVLAALAGAAEALIMGEPWPVALAVVAYAALIGGTTAVGALHTVKRLAGKPAEGPKP